MMVCDKTNSSANLTEISLIIGISIVLYNGFRQDFRHPEYPKMIKPIVFLLIHPKNREIRCMIVGTFFDSRFYNY